MRILTVIIICLLLVLAGRGEPPRGEKLPSLPDHEGFAGAYSGVVGEMLVIAGGANFPEKKPWEGGKKVWYDTVFALDKLDGKWTLAGRLPRPLGYGVSVTHRGSIVCVGGSDADRHYSESFRIEIQSEKLVISPLPSLPIPVANGCGALVGDTLYVAGGQEKPDSKETLKKMFALDLGAKKPTWKEVEAWPGPGRMLAQAAQCDGAFWLTGGVDLAVTKGDMVTRKYLNDAYRFDPGKGWKKVDDLPCPIAAAPSPLPNDETGFSILGGDDGTQIGVSPDKHRGFSRKILRYDLRTGKWSEAGELVAPRVTTPCVFWQKRWVIPGGEVRPGVRSPEVWAMKAE
jgi:N-acetylneuraminic acid mutarotase